jgi:hypothetical protein
MAKQELCLKRVPKQELGNQKEKSTGETPVPPKTSALMLSGK